MKKQTVTRQTPGGALTSLLMRFQLPDSQKKKKKKKQLSIKSATKVVLNNMEKKLPTTSWLSETMVKPPNCPKKQPNCVLDLFQHKLI